MDIDAEAREQLATRLGEVLGDEPADTLMSGLPPMNWSELATRADLDRLADQMGQRFEQVDQRFVGVDQGFVSMGERFEQVDRRFEQVDLRMDALSTDVDRGFADVGRRLHRIERSQERLEDSVSSLNSNFVEATLATTMHLNKLDSLPLTIVLTVIGAMIALSAVLVAAVRI